MKITQIKNGMQPRPYADHVYEWEIITEKSAAEVLVYCLEKLRHAKRDELTYWKDYRDRSKSFDEHMEVVSGGYYTLSRIQGGFKYRVIEEYID